MIREPEASPSYWDILPRVRYPSHHRVFDSILFQFLDIWFYVCPFIFYYVDTITEESLFPGILWMIADVECINIATRLDIRTVYLSTGTVIVEISRIL